MVTAAPDTRSNEMRDCTVLALTGLSPAVLTETLYAMSVLGVDGTKWWPSRIVVVTTTEGQRHIANPDSEGDFYCRPLNEVLAEMSAQYRAELGGRQFPPVDVIVPTLGPEPGVPIDDVDTPEKLNAMADCLGKKFRELVTRAKPADPEPLPVHLSAAGGRNGMGFVASQVIGLFGRDEDVASQILVSPDRVTQAQPRFYFVDKNVQHYHVPSTGEAIKKKNIHLSLIKLPRLLIQTLLDTDEQKLIFERNLSLSQIVAGVNERFVAHKMVIDTKAMTIRVGSQTLVPPVGYREKSSPVAKPVNRWSGLITETGSPPVAAPKLPEGVSEVSWQMWAFLYWIGTTEELYWSVRPLDFRKDTSKEGKLTDHARDFIAHEKARQARLLTRWPQQDGAKTDDRILEFKNLSKAILTDGPSGFDFEELVKQMGQTRDYVEENLLKDAVKWGNPLMRHFFKIDRRGPPPADHGSSGSLDDSIKPIANWRFANINLVVVDGQEIDHGAYVYVKAL